jgi:integrase
MASGHVNRINRPNTWLHRPATRREVLTCQPGAVHTWHEADSAIGCRDSLRRTKATLLYRRTGNLRAVQLLLGHTKIESTVRYLGIEVDDALAISEQVDV